MAHQLLPTMLNYTRIFLTGRTLGFPTPRLEDVIEIVRRFHCSSALAVLLRLNLALTHSRAPGQTDILRRWAGPELAEQIFAVVREDRIDVVFHEGQVLNLIRLVILNSPTDEDLRCDRPEDFWLLTRALLMISDLVYPHSGVEVRASIFTNFTRSELFMHDEQYVPYTMARNHDLFIMLPRLVPYRGTPFNMAETLRTLTGLDIEDYLALGFALLSHYDGIDPADVGGTAIDIHAAQYFKDVHVPPERRDGIWRVVSKGP